MAIYKYFRLHFGGGSIFVFTTDDHFGQEVIKAIRKIEESCDVSGTNQSFQVRKLKGRHMEIGRWLIKTLLLHAWEPFAVSTGAGGELYSYPGMAHEAFHFRKLDETEEGTQ